MTQDRFEVADISLQITGGFWVEREVQENVLTFSLFADLVRHSTAAPDIHFIHTSACFADPARDAVDYTFKCSLIQFGLDNANEFVFAHEGFLLSVELLLFEPWVRQ